MTRNFILNPENQFTFTNIFSFLMIDLQKGAKFFLKGEINNVYKFSSRKKLKI